MKTTHPVHSTHASTEDHTQKPAPKDHESAAEQHTHAAHRAAERDLRAAHKADEQHTHAAHKADLVQHSEKAKLEDEHVAKPHPGADPSPAPDHKPEATPESAVATVEPPAEAPAGSSIIEVGSMITLLDGREVRVEAMMWAQGELLIQVPGSTGWVNATGATVC